jgi:hypothetical protein
MRLRDANGSSRTACPDSILDDLERDGVVVLDDVLNDADFRHARDAFAAAAERLSWNTQPGFFHTDPFRRMVPDVLRLDEAFVALATAPTLLDVCSRYIGSNFILTEAKGWRSNPTRRDFHGWHNDAWYAPELSAVPRQLKLGVYLSDVTTGAFQYRLGSHKKHRPRHWTDEGANDEGPLKGVLGPAGTVFLFDSSGVHRQETPIVTARDAAFLVFHDPDVPLQSDDLVADRYHPLIVNTASLSDLDAEQLRSLGVGTRALQRRGYQPPPRSPALQRTIETLTRTHITASRGVGRLRDMMRARLRA